ncbi:MAG: hypothetical protein KAS49_00010 [Candidatus Cloacimonetes bacterium]|nr:hypothetical protein [Candidatus Cloacimonadota bacterium]
MNALLDTLGATIIGAMFMLTVLTSMHSIQAMSHNTHLAITLVNITEKVSALLDYHYLSAVGTGLSPGSSVITEATATKIAFTGELNGTLRTIEFIREDFDNTLKGYPIIVEVDNVADYGPFYSSNSNDGSLSGMNITYYNSNDVEIPIAELNTQINRNDIRSIRVEMELFYNTYRRDLQAIDIKHRITFWKYFTNLYL